MALLVDKDFLEWYNVDSEFLKKLMIMILILKGYIMKKKLLPLISLILALVTMATCFSSCEEILNGEGTGDVSDLLTYI